MDLEIVILGKSDRERQISYDIAYMQTLTKWYKWTYLQNRNRLIDLREWIYGYKGGRFGRGDRLGLWDWHVHTVAFKTYNQQGPTVQHR